MHLPDISPRHRSLVRAIAVAGTSALALVRSRDFAPEHDRAARLGNAVTNAGLTWIVGTKAFAGPLDGEFDLGAVWGPGEEDEGQAVRYSTVDPRKQAEKAQSFRNLTTAFASGAFSWALWHPTQNFADTIDAKFPTGFGRGLGAAASGTFVAACAALLDKFEEHDQIEDLEYAPVEIELPEHIRGAVNQLLAQPHPVSAEAADTARAQFKSARFFVWVTYSRTQHPGDEPITLDARQLAELLRDEDVSNIDVYPEASSALIVPAQQTYPVVGTQDADASARLELTLDIVDGRLSSLNLFGTDADSPPRTSAELSTAAKSGTLHPLGLGGDGVGYSSSFEVEDEEFDDGPLTLAQWPEPNQLTFVADRTNCHHEHQQQAPGAEAGITGTHHGCTEYE
ncbi:hypothetical protein [Brevibacterium aurantiacum]|uniref:hypothetical protein n=1 Tax=Brevibacterium aurantiacum TaxID=273384 RepID=UPI0018690247|nr:hypothetical protein [Brevibacterium aurantiacum]